MPRPKSGLDLYQPLIELLHQGETSITEIQSVLQSQGCTASRRTIQRRLNEWKSFRRCRVRTNDPRLIEQVDFIYQTGQPPDSEIAAQASLKLNATVSEVQVKRVRNKLGLLRRNHNSEKKGSRSKKKMSKGVVRINDMAVVLKGLHRSGKPLVLANVCDYLSARAVAELESCKAIATASYGVARAIATEDDDMTMEQNLGVVRLVGKVARENGKPLTVDLQDGYGEELEEAIRRVVEAGAVGINLEDCDKASGVMHTVDVAVERVRTAVRVAKEAGVGDFVVNARCDTLIHGGEIDEVVLRGKRYLEAGATCVFVWGGSKRGVLRQEVERMVKEFDGRLNVSLKFAPDGLTIKELAEIGVARISVGPTLQFFAMAEYKKKAEELLSQA